MKKNSSGLRPLLVGLTLTIGILLDRVTVGGIAAYWIIFGVLVCVFSLRTLVKGKIPSPKWFRSFLFLSLIFFVVSYSVAFLLAEQKAGVVPSGTTVSLNEGLNNPRRVIVITLACLMMSLVLQGTHRWWVGAARISGLFSIATLISVITDNLGLTQIGYLLSSYIYALSPGILGEPNFGAQLLGTVFVLNMIGIMADSRRYRMFYYVAICATILAVLIIGSRMGWLMLVCELTISFCLFPKVRYSLIMACAMCAMVCLIGMTITLRGQEVQRVLLERGLTILAYLRGEDLWQLAGYSSMAKRKGLLELAMRGWLQKPITGVGPQNTIHYFSSYPHLKNLWAHNTFAEVLLGSGLLGAIPYIILVVSSGVALWSARTRLPSPYGFTFAPVFVGYIGHLVTLLFLSDIYGKLFWNFYIPVALIASVKQGKSRSKEWRPEHVL